jgi:glycosyltransferase involved in cell wall biosynthesis
MPLSLGWRQPLRIARRQLREVVTPLIVSATEQYQLRFVILLYPLVMQNVFYKGVLWIMGNADHVVRRFPDIRRYFLIISTASSRRKWAVGSAEDVHGLTLASYAGDYRAEKPDGRCLVIRNADFIAETEFYPAAVAKEYDVLFNSTASPVKRHELFIAVLRELRDRYHRDVRAAVVLWSGPPRLANSMVRPSVYYRALAPWLDRERRAYARHILTLYARAMDEGLRITRIAPMFRSNEQTIPRLRALYSKSKAYVLLSQTEGLNRTVKEAMLCDTPAVAINGSATATELLNARTGKAVDDDLRAICEGILDVVDHRERYTPRAWVLQHCSRMTICRALWETINSFQTYPGYPSIEAATRLRRDVAAMPLDDYVSLNGWNGAGSRGSLTTEMRAVRRRFEGLV